MKDAAQTKARVGKIAAALPRSIKIGPYVYDIILHDDGLARRGRGHWGECDNNALQIHIAAPAMMAEPAFFASVVLHEMLHAIWAVRDIDAKMKEEAIVSHIEKGLIAIMRDNAELLRWFALALADNDACGTLTD